MWGGIEHEHEFEDVHRLQRSGVNHDGGAGYREREDRRYIVGSGMCACGAWLGSLGLEPTPDLFVEHLIEVFRHARRVLRNDGTLWLNLGDSYAGSGKETSNDGSKQKTNAGSLITNHRNPAQFANGQAPTSWISTPAGLKPKDLLMIPFRVAMALQADGWWLRSVIPWVKRNSMPESVNDRPSTSVEYVFLLAKSARYYWDADAVRSNYNSGSLGRYRTSLQATAPTSRQPGADVERKLREAAVRDPNPNGRNRRNSDWFFESWQGLLLDEQDDPLALVVNPAPFSGSFETVRRRPVSLDAIDGDTRRIASPTCPVHASGDSPDSNGQGDERADASVVPPRSPDTDNRRAPAQPFGSAAILPTGAEGSSLQSSDSQDQQRSEIATGRSSGSRRMDLDPATNQPCIASAQTADHIPHTSKRRATADWAGRISENSSGPVDSADLLLSQTSGRTAGTPSIRASSSACDCSYYKEYTEKSSHFATFPPKLVEPMVKASTRAGDTLLDPFGGAGTVGLVADRLGRHAILCDLKDSYAQMAAERITSDAPLFAQVAD